MDGQDALVVEDDVAISDRADGVLTKAGHRPVTIADSPVVIFRGDSALDQLLATVQRTAEGPAAPARAIGVPNGSPAAVAWPEADFFAILVHELRQPLTVIRGQLQLAGRRIGKDPERERDAVDCAIAQVDRMGRLLSALLDAAALATSGLSLKAVVFDLVPAIVDAIARHEDGETRRIAFRRAHGPVRVRGDPDRTAEILDNLLGNACKYSPAAAPIEVSLTIRGGAAQVRVADRGLGVPAEERTRLFTPFYRASSSRNVPGTGLGLHISRRLAERQGGRLWLEASSNAGSVFTLELLVAISEHGSAGEVGALTRP